MPTPEVCPNCGEDVPPKARACPHCGSDEHTGWSDRADADRLGLPSEDFDYDAFIKEEFKTEKPSRQPKGIGVFWWIVGIGVLLALLKFTLF
mgnify:CR=1 FL=1